MDEVKVIRWLKNVGDDVLVGEPLLEVETEKSVVEIEAAVTGRLTQIVVQVDGQALVGDQVAWIEFTEAGAAKEGPLSTAASSTVVPSVAPTTPTAARAP